MSDPPTGDRASRWPLTALLALAEREELEARLELAQALWSERRLRHERDARAEAVRLEERAWRCAASELAHGTCGLAGALQARARHLDGLRSKLQRLREDLAASDSAVAAAAETSAARLGSLASARAAVRALELHRERWLLSRRRLRDRHEEIEGDDVSVRRRAAP